MSTVRKFYQLSFHTLFQINIYAEQYKVPNKLLECQWPPHFGNEPRVSDSEAAWTDWLDMMSKSFQLILLNYSPQAF